jgi:hypothetical protein
LINLGAEYDAPGDEVGYHSFRATATKTFHSYSGLSDVKLLYLNYFQSGLWIYIAHP